MSDLARLVGALVFVLALIGLCAWILRRYGPAMRLGRPGRLALVESIAVDSRRRLVLVRRDQTEHLLLIGGTRDLVVESGIRPGATASGQGRTESGFAHHLPSEGA